MATGKTGKTLGNFVVEEEIGRGGMGVVLRARQPMLDRSVVLKKVRRDLADLDGGFEERFRREARAAGAVHHPNVVTVYDYFTLRGDHYIAQEFVDGVDLSAALARLGNLPSRIASLVALELVRGLEEIHAQGTVHRDLKPSNVLLGQRGEVKIGDFGIALEATGSRLTQPGMLMGTPPYMPPEQLRGERVDTRSDLFSLGALWYELLAGDTPYPEPDLDFEDAEPLLRSMERENFKSLGRAAPRTPRGIRRCVHRCLRAKPKRRFSSARELRSVLEGLLGRPSAADLRSELALYLWDRGVFQRRDNQTVVLAPPVDLFRRRRLGWIPTTVAACAIAALILFVDPSSHVPDEDAPSEIADATGPAVEQAAKDSSDTKRPSGLVAR